MAFTLGEIYGDVLLDFSPTFIMENRRYDIVEQVEEEGRDINEIFSAWFIDLYNRYKVVKKKSLERAQKKIYFWIIPIIYDITRESGRRLASKNYQKFLEIYV
jgi:hypothetical protein